MNTTPEPNDPLGEWLQQRRSAFQNVGLSAQIMAAVRPVAGCSSRAVSRTVSLESTSVLFGFIRFALILLYLINPI